MDGAQIGFGPWRSNLRKSFAVEYSRGYIQFTKCTISIVIVNLLFFKIPMQIDISIRTSDLIFVQLFRVKGDKSI